MIVTSILLFAVFVPLIVGMVVIMPTMHMIGVIINLLLVLLLPSLSFCFSCAFYVFCSFFSFFIFSDAAQVMLITPASS